tara:strand:+ start:336 stop:527 length:192 start_codon:yes stop_codon:yes gene_type:complete
MKTYRYQIEEIKLGSEIVRVYTVYLNGFIAKYTTKQDILIGESGNSANRYALRAFGDLRKLAV